MVHVPFRLRPTFALLAVASLLAVVPACSKKPVAKPPEPAQPAPVEDKPTQEVQVEPKTDFPKAEKPQVEALPDDFRAIAEKYLKDVFYDFDRYELSDESREALAANAEFLKKYPKVRVTVEGHCDERGTREYNLALGEKRAAAAKEYLVALGVADDRIAVVSYGKERPFDPGHDEEAWAKNRRGHFVVTAK